MPSAYLYQSSLWVYCEIELIDSMMKPRNIYAGAPLNLPNLQANDCPSECAGNKPAGCSEMKVSHTVKGLANHSAPSQCVEWSKSIKAKPLTGGNARWGIETAKGAKVRDADLFGKGEGNNQRPHWQGTWYPARSEPQQASETTCARTGSSCGYPSGHAWVACEKSKDRRR